MNPNWILINSKNPRDEKQTNKKPKKTTTNDITFAIRSFSHLDNNGMIHELTNQVLFFFHQQIKAFC